MNSTSDEMVKAIFFCAVKNCYNTSENTPHLKFYKFPLPDTPTLNAWLGFCKDPSLYSNKVMKTCKRLCGAHFKPSDFTNLTELKPGAIPSILNTLKTPLSFKRVLAKTNCGSSQKEQVETIDLSFPEEDSVSSRPILQVPMQSSSNLGLMLASDLLTVGEQPLSNSYYLVGEEINHNDLNNLEHNYSQLDKTISEDNQLTCSQVDQLASTEVDVLTSTQAAQSASTQAAQSPSTQVDQLSSTQAAQSPSTQVDQLSSIQAAQLSSTQAAQSASTEIDVFSAEVDVFSAEVDVVSAEVDVFSTEVEQLADKQTKVQTHAQQSACKSPSPTVLSRLTKWSNTCRLCFQHLNKESQWLFANGKCTSLGQRFILILNQSDVFEIEETVPCCEDCALKIQSCFLMMIEIRTKEWVLTKLNKQLELKEQTIDVNRQIFYCGKCGEDQIGMQTYIQHYEDHILEEANKDEASHQLAEQNSFFKETPPSSNDKQYLDKLFFSEFSDMEKSMLTKDLNDHESDEESLFSDDEVLDCVYEALNSNDDTDEDEAFNDVDIKIFENKYLCPKCEQKYDFKFQLRFHLNTHNNPWDIRDYFGTKILEEKVQMDEDKIDFLEEKPRKRKYRKRIKIDSGNPTKETNQVFCIYCQELVPRIPKQYLAHKKACRDAFKSQESILCNCCGKFISPTKYKIHLLHARRKLKARECFKCNHKFLNESNYLSHLPCSGPRQKIVCTDCGLLLSRRHMRKHKRAQHTPNGTVCGCPICPQTFVLSSQVDVHLLSHTSDEVTSTFNKRCKRCNARFLDLKLYQEHLLQVHKIGKNIESCSQCDQKFLSKYSLQKHLSRDHQVPLKTRIQTCRICHVDIPSNLSRNNHNKMFHKKSAENLYCPICGKTKPTEYKINLHLLLAHRNYEALLPRECSICNLGFSRLSELQGHMQDIHYKGKTQQRADDDVIINAECLLLYDFIEDGGCISTEG